MAEQVPTPSTALDKLQEQLTCPVCLSQFDSPKTLPCLHSFCLECIQQLPVDLEKGKYVISCPTCRKTAQVPNKGPADLPTAFVINSFIEIQEQLKKVFANDSSFSSGWRMMSVILWKARCVSLFQYSVYYLSFSSSKAIPKSLKEIAQECERSNKKSKCIMICYHFSENYRGIKRWRYRGKEKNRKH